MTLVDTLVAGGSHIDHADMLRSGDTRRVLPFRVAAPSTLGTFLRSFTFGHVRQLDAVIAETLRRVWGLGAGPGGDRLVIDVDSTICEVYGYNKPGAAYGYTGEKGYHPLVAFRADTGEVLHVRLRKGSSQKGDTRFIGELIARVRRAGATGEILLRADAGFWSRKTIDTRERLGVSYSITVNANPTIRAAIDGIPEAAWVRTDDPDGGDAEVASIAYVSKGTGQARDRPKTVRLVVRRTRIIGKQPALWPDWRHHVIATNRPDADVTLVDQQHRHHAVVELAIRDLKPGAGLNHLPSGNFSANGAWVACAVLAHNLIRWTAILGDPDTRNTLAVAATFRTQLVALPGRIVNRAGRLTLRLPTRLALGRTIRPHTHPNQSHPPTRLNHLPSPSAPQPSQARRQHAQTPPSAVTPPDQASITPRPPETSPTPTTPDHPADHPPNDQHADDDRWIQAQWGKGPPRRRSGVGGLKAREMNSPHVPERVIMLARERPPTALSPTQWGKGPSGEAPGRRRSGVGGSKAREMNLTRSGTRHHAREGKAPNSFVPHAAWIHRSSGDWGWCLTREMPPDLGR